MGVPACENACLDGPAKAMPAGISNANRIIIIKALGLIIFFTVTTPFIFTSTRQTSINRNNFIEPIRGVKVFFNPNTFVSSRYRYEWYFDNLDVGSDSSEGNHVVTIGFGYVWGGEGNRQIGHY